MEWNNITPFPGRINANSNSDKLKKSLQLDLNYGVDPTWGSPKPYPKQAMYDNMRCPGGVCFGPRSRDPPTFITQLILSTFFFYTATFLVLL